MIKRDLYYERIPTKSLREDVRYLGDVLGRVIKKQEGQSFFKLVEDTRLLSKANLANKHIKDPFKKILKKICPSCFFITLPKMLPKYLTSSLSDFVGIRS